MCLPFGHFLTLHHPLRPFPQVFSRFAIVYIMAYTPSIQDSWSIQPTVFAWSITEVRAPATRSREAAVQPAVQPSPTPANVPIKQLAGRPRIALTRRIG